MDGAAKCWGAGAWLGTGLGTDRAFPVQVLHLTSGVEAITAGWEHACALQHGNLWCWGSDSYGQILAPDVIASLEPIQVSVPWP